MTHPTVLCPVDFSIASRGALRYAAAVAEHFFAELSVITVNHPQLADAADAAYGEGWAARQSRGALEQFVHEALAGRQPEVAGVTCRVLRGMPAHEIVLTATITRADLVVMSTHGIAGGRKAPFGSTTERVLRETATPILVTPAGDGGPDSLEEVRERVGTVLAPVDLSAASPRQVRVACGLAEALGASLVLLHVLEPLAIGAGQESVASTLDADRRASARRTLDELRLAVAPAVQPAVVLASGDPAGEIARIARERRAGVVVIGLHSPPDRGRGVGAVTYRVLCQVGTPVLALPSAAAPGSADRGGRVTAELPA